MLTQYQSYDFQNYNFTYREIFTAVRRATIHLSKAIPIGHQFTQKEREQNVRSQKICL